MRSSEDIRAVQTQFADSKIKINPSLHGLCAYEITDKTLIVYSHRHRLNDPTGETEVDFLAVKWTENRRGSNLNDQGTYCVLTTPNNQTRDIFTNYLAQNGFTVGE